MSELKGSIRDSQACPGTGATGSWRRGLAERDEMEPPKAAVKIFGCDSAERPQEALELAVVAGGRLDVPGPAHPFVGGAIAASGIGDEQGVRGDHRGQRLLHAVRVECRKGSTEGRAAASETPCSVQSHSAPRCLANRLALCKRCGKGPPPLLAAKPGQRRAGESAEGAAAGLAPVAGQTARLAPGHRRCSSIPSSVAASEASPPVDSTEPQQLSKTSPETAPDPLFRSPWSMQVGTKCIAYACEMRTEPIEKGFDPLVRCPLIVADPASFSTVNSE